MKGSETEGLPKLLKRVWINTEIMKSLLT